MAAATVSPAPAPAIAPDHRIAAIVDPSVQPGWATPKLQAWVLAARCTAATGEGEEGRPLTADHERMVIVADLP